MISVRSGATPDPSVRQWLDALAYSSMLAASVAGALTAAATLALELPLLLSVIVLAISGTLVVYNIDRLRDLEYDRPHAPRRSAFIDRHRKRLGLLIILAAMVSGICALQLAPAAWGLCAGVLALGLMHLRLKHIRGIKTLYLTLAWLAVVLGLPLLGSGSTAAAPSLYWIILIMGCAIASNLLASDFARRIPDESRRRIDDRSRIGSAIVIAGLGVGTALVGPDALRSLVFIPLAELLLLCRFREGEHYALVVIDGALFAGACGAIMLQLFA